MNFNFLNTNYCMYRPAQKPSQPQRLNRRQTMFCTLLHQNFRVAERMNYPTCLETSILSGCRFGTKTKTCLCTNGTGLQQTRRQKNLLGRMCIRWHRRSGSTSLKNDLFRKPHTKTRNCLGSDRTDSVRTWLLHFEKQSKIPRDKGNNVIDLL